MRQTTDIWRASRRRCRTGRRSSITAPSRRRFTKSPRKWRGGRRREASHPPSIFIVVFGLQRYRSLRKSEESFGFSSGGDEAKPIDSGKEFADLMRDGPANGIHILTWIDTATALDRAVDRGSMRELDNRILFQMSATDSSNLIDSPAGNKLGVNRALAYSEEQGSMEKFRPYAVPNAKWLAEVKEKLAAKCDGQRHQARRRPTRSGGGPGGGRRCKAEACRLRMPRMSRMRRKATTIRTRRRSSMGVPPMFFG